MGKASDGFAWSPDDPAVAEHELLTALIASVPTRHWEVFPSGTPTGKAITNLKGEAAVRAALACVQRIQALEPELARIRSASGYDPRRDNRWEALWHPRQVLQDALRVLLRKKLPFDAPEVRTLVAWAAADTQHSMYLVPFSGIVKACENYAARHDVRDLCPPLEALRERLLAMSLDRDARKLCERVEALLGVAPAIPIEKGEAWSDQALADIEALSADEQAAWAGLLSHCLGATGGKPTAKWTKQARVHLDAVGPDAAKAMILRWLPLLDAVETWQMWIPGVRIDDRNQDLLKGLVWCAPLIGAAELAPCLATAALSTYRKIPGIGPRAVKLGNACVYALGALESDSALAALAMLKVRVKFGTAQQGIEKALGRVAERTGIDRAELEELGTPAFGMEEVGVRRETLGDFEAELAVVGRGRTQLSWIKADGKRQKSVPKSVREQHGDDLKELKQAARSIEQMLLAQRDRLDTVFLLKKQWPLGKFRERYLDHPLVGTLARRLVWSVAVGSAAPVPVIWFEGALCTRTGEKLDADAGAIVTPWHPIDAPADEVLAWRDWFEEHEVVQPFKQAHREVYLLTDAERATGTYSNRFAAHVLKQHQFNALCAARGWRNTLRLMVDDEYEPPTRYLPQFGLRAEYWVEGLGDQYGVDTNEAGTYLYLGTDQVRFYRDDASPNTAHASGGGYGSAGIDQPGNHPLRLEDVPALVLSEVLRDVDLFVGVASVGNDPNWFDGGPEGRFTDYWDSYSFGELSGSALTRKATLERLLPRLKIRDRCSLEDRFLVVKGKLRTYRIHLGSSNILMEPNDQYLCIVPAQSGTRSQVFLPFEGDQRLSVILSKAMLLAADDRIEDPTIVSQIKPP